MVDKRVDRLSRGQPVYVCKLCFFKAGREEGQDTIIDRLLSALHVQIAGLLPVSTVLVSFFCIVSKDESHLLKTAMSACTFDPHPSSQQSSWKDRSSCGQGFSIQPSAA